MDFVSSYATPPPYSRLDEDATAQSQGKLSVPGNDVTVTSNNYSLGEAKKEDAGKVTISFEEPVQNRRKEKRKCVLKSFLCGCSLRTGCITVAVLYSLYMVFFVGIAISIFVVTVVENEVDYFSSLWGFNVALFECCMAVFIIVFISIGVRKKTPRRLHVAKWLMTVDLCLNLLEEIHIAFLMDVYGLLLHFVMQIIPAYFIFVVHSYEVQLEMSEQVDTAPIPPPRTDSNTAFTSVN